MVAVAMKSDSVGVCTHCRKNFAVRVSNDVGFYFHWVKRFYLIDVVLLNEKGDKGFYQVLYRMVFKGS